MISLFFYVPIFVLKNPRFTCFLLDIPRITWYYITIKNNTFANERMNKMKKYNLSKIMKTAWEIRKSWHSRGLTFGECLKRAWAKAKAELQEAVFYGTKFVNHMDVVADGYTRELVRWTKGGYDRVYINGGSRKGDGYVDLKTRRTFLRGNLTYQKKIADMILSMEF